MNKWTTEQHILTSMSLPIFLYKCAYSISITFQKGFKFKLYIWNDFFNSIFNIIFLIVNEP